MRPRYMNKYLISTLIMLVLFVAACTVNPVTLKRELNMINEEREIRLGRNASVAVSRQFGGIYEDAALQRYVDDVGQSLVRGSERDYLQFSFEVVDSPILNAFALPGGYIYITRGLLAELENEAQLAAVLGHEVGHVCARHSVVQLSEALSLQVLTLASLAAGPNAGEMVAVASTLSQTMMAGYSREREYQADSMGLTYMYRAGYDPLEMSDFLNHLSKRVQGPAGYSVYNASHPDIFERIRETRSNAKIMLSLDIAREKLIQNGASEQSTVTKEEVLRNQGKVNEELYTSHLDGLLYGPPQHPRRIRVYTVKEQGETLDSIAERTLGDSRRAEEIADLNDLEKDAPLSPGKKLKVVYQ